MNKGKLVIFTALLSLSLASCNLDNDSDNNYMIGTYRCSNLVIPTSGTPYATDATYNLTFYYMNGTVSAATSDLTIGHTSYNFTTNPMPCETKLYSVDWSSNTLDVSTFSGGSANANGLMIKNLNGFTSAAVNILSTNDPVNPAFPFNSRLIPLVINYEVNSDYTVKTFMPDAIYRGITHISTQGSTAEPFTSSDIRYRVVFSTDYSKADIIFYQAKFADMMPVTINFVLQGLDVKFTDSGYTISNANGDPIIPSLYESDGLTPAPNYQFTSFEFTNTSDDLTVGAAMYTVQIGNARYNGDFNGYYVLSGKEN